MAEPQFPQAGLNTVVRSYMAIVPVVSPPDWAIFTQVYAESIASGIPGGSDLKIVLQTNGAFLAAVNAVQAYDADQAANLAEAANDAGFASAITSFEA